MGRLAWRDVAEVRVDPARARVYEHGWQSWSPSTTYPVAATSHRASRSTLQTMCWRPERPPPPSGFQGEGLLAVDPGDGDPVRLFAAADGRAAVPSFRARLHGDRLMISTDGSDADLVESASPGPLDAALGTWADGFARLARTEPLRAAPTAWCSWYAYFGGLTADDVLENVAAVNRADLPIDVIQIDDGWQSEIGDWTTSSDGFPALGQLVARIRDMGRRAGIWIAPFLVGARSELCRDHPDWLVEGADAGHNWDQDLFALDVTHPGAAAHLGQVLAGLREAGVDYFKLDFTYAGGLDGRRHDSIPAIAAYRRGLSIIRDAVGTDAFVLGSGAPILPSVGLVDALRVSADIDVRLEPVDGDMSRPSLRAAALSVVGRAWQHGRFWVNDPDCLLARPEVPHRSQWARLVERFGGSRCSGDRIADLDGWGLATTRRLLANPPPPTPFA